MHARYLCPIFEPNMGSQAMGASQPEEACYYTNIIVRNMLLSLLRKSGFVTPFFPPAVPLSTIATPCRAIFVVKDFNNVDSEVALKMLSKGWQFQKNQPRLCGFGIFGPRNWLGHDPMCFFIVGYLPKPSEPKHCN